MDERELQPIGLGIRIGPSIPATSFTSHGRIRPTTLTFCQTHLAALRSFSSNPARGLNDRPSNGGAKVIHLTAFTMAMIPARTAHGNAGQAQITSANSGWLCSAGDKSDDKRICGWVLVQSAPAPTVERFCERQLYQFQSDRRLCGFDQVSKSCEPGSKSVPARGSWEPSSRSVPATGAESAGLVAW
jgi:hypothetical protein